MRLQGVVIVGADISATGRVTLATVARSCGHAILDEAAVEAVRLWIFTPAREGGENVATHAEIPVRFSLAQ
jgi:protein TonB